MFTTKNSPNSSSQESLNGVNGPLNIGSQVESYENHKKKTSKFIQVGNVSPLNKLSKRKIVKKTEFNAAKNTPRCSECNRKFSSRKALYGHMRSHPERQWRGMNPPRKVQSGRSATFSPGTFFSKRVLEVAATLLMLSSESRAMDVAPLQTIDPRQNEAVDLIAGRSGAGGLDTDSLSSHQALDAHKNVEGGSTSTGPKDGEEEKKMTVVSAHQCSICLRVFSSGEALGGHQRCHLERRDDHIPHGLLDLNLPPPIEID